MGRIIEMRRARSAHFFEVAWEVCQQIGGIYTVLKSKVPAMLERWGDDYTLIGPYNSATAAIEFEETSIDDRMRAVVRELKHANITVHVGRWLIPGKPRVILLDSSLRTSSLDRDKYFLWRDHGIETQIGDREVDETITFGFTVAEFFRIASAHLTDAPILAHFHEWMAGVAIPRIAHLKLPVGTIFTTHATLLGRYVAGDNPNFYHDLKWIDPDATARRYNIYPRFSIERAAAHSSMVFTTISEVTGQEATKFLGRVPDFILPNGLNVQRFTAIHEFQNLHREYKERINEFVMGHFFPSYTFNLDRTIYLFTSGRYEYRNKGMDLFIESLYRLNQRLKETTNPPTVVAFIVTKGATRNINVGTLQKHIMLEDLKSIGESLESNLAQRVLNAAAMGRMPSYEELLPHDTQVQLKRAMHAFKTPYLPSIVTHDMLDDSTDPVLNHLRHRGLFNQPSDPVKVVFHPEFVTSTSPILGLDYDQFVRGCHMGVFPSYYEPWGYTPLECIALGIPAVTTDLSGFGAYVQGHIPDARERGIYVLNRSSLAPHESIEELSSYLHQFVQLGRRERIELRNRAERLTESFDWATLVKHYHRSHDEALLRLSLSGLTSTQRVG